jgi:uncharacterized protein
MLVLVHKEVETEWTKELRDAIVHDFVFVPKVDLSVITKNELITNRVHEKLLVKTMAACVFGEDISDELPNYKPNAQLAHDLQTNIRSFLEAAKEKLPTKPDASIPIWSTWMMKRFIRTGFFICMPRIQQRTVDIETEVAVFCEFYPHKATEMRHALAWLRTPATNREELINFINTFGEWLTQEAEKELHLPLSSA